MYPFLSWQELFVEMIAKDAMVYVQQGKRKTLQRKDLGNSDQVKTRFENLISWLDTVDMLLTIRKM